MANPFQLRSRRRKVIYLVLVLVLFTVSLMHRRFLVEPLAARLQMLEQTQGEVELTSSAVQYLLVGSKGLATCALWQVAIDKQERHQWNELELVVRSITKLQPHFVSPWRFQSWNLAFNVAVECERPRDKYFYISRGMQLLAEGERRNQGIPDDVTIAGESLHFPGNPEMRFDLGFFYHLKMARSDDLFVMHCLLDLSCIDPAERDPLQLREPGNGPVKQKEFRRFCELNPRLVRRLREKLGRNTPEMVVRFLEENRDIPSRFVTPEPGMKNTPLIKPSRDQFPVLPAPRDLTRFKYLPDLGERDYRIPNPTWPTSFDVYSAEQAWMLYAQEPLPQPSRNPALEDAEFDPMRHRLPKIAPTIFRSQPCRSQAYLAEFLGTVEGFFDSTQGWTIRDWFDADAGPSGSERGRKKIAVPVGTQPEYHSKKAWEKTYQSYLEFGQKNGLYYSPERLAELDRDAKVYRRSFKPNSAEPDEEYRRKLRRGALRAGEEAYLRLRWSGTYRRMTNFDAYLAQSRVERTDEGVAVRKLFFQADAKRDEGDRHQARLLYKEALPRWWELMLANADLRKIEDMQNDTYNRQVKYFELMEIVRSRAANPVEKFGAALVPLGLSGPGVPVALGVAAVQHELTIRERIAVLGPIGGPYDMVFHYEVPDTAREALKEYLQGLTQGAQWLGAAPGGQVIAGPPTAFEQNRILTTRIAQKRPDVDQRWRPVLPVLFVEMTAAQMEEMRQRMGPTNAPGGAKRP
jgi:hypothetical protein